MPVQPFDVAKAVALVEDGRSIRYAARTLGFPYTNLQRAITRYRETHEFTRRPGSGRRRITSARDDRFLVSTILRNRNCSAVTARNRLLEVRNVNVCENTVRRRLHENNLKSYRPATGPKLHRHHRVARLNYARDHSNWNVNQWSNVLFSDESRFCINSPDGREKVWRRPGERFAQCNISPRVPFHGGSLMVWAGIAFDARTDLVFIENGSLTAVRYIEEILDQYVVPFAPFIGELFLFMHDNARPHTAQIVRLYLEDVRIPTMDWPACSPDCNPIEHLWDMLGRRVKKRLIVPDNFNDLRVALSKEWESIPQQLIQNLINSMPRRMEAVIRARGGNTQY
jgi:transposase